eukprot:13209-Rhodomonas_salina.1
MVTMVTMVTMMMPMVTMMMTMMVMTMMPMMMVMMMVMMVMMVMVMVMMMVMVMVMMVVMMVNGRAGAPIPPLFSTTTPPVFSRLHRAVADPDRQPRGNSRTGDPVLLLSRPPQSDSLVARSARRQAASDARQRFAGGARRADGARRPQAGQLPHGQQGPQAHRLRHRQAGLLPSRRAPKPQGGCLVGQLRGWGDGVWCRTE